ncbi:MAG: hypothetical protein NW223_15500 [Hyphomicrobiaceae bacterium]|nr:hypothetical protein [Hyphomicrobiaceae bacterium]
MRIPVLLGALALALLAPATANAQGFGVGVYVGPTYDDYEDYGYSLDVRQGRRVYDYGPSYDVDRNARRGGRPGGCGTYHFWNGETCVDARNR